VKKFTIAPTPAKALTSFTAHIGKWWPPGSHSLSADAGETAKNVQMQPFVGGLILETMYDDKTVQWGVITAWEPGCRVAFTWRLHRPENQQTHVSVKFSLRPTGTLLRLVHSEWDALVIESENNHAQYKTCWDYVLQAYTSINFGA